MILVTGCAGFIGSALSRRLLDEGYKVTGVDAFRDFYARSIKERNIEDLRKRPGFTFVEGDINKMDLSAILEGKRFVFHEAAHAGVRQSWGDGFRDYVNDNILGTKSVLDACRGKGIEKFVLASSSSVYGNSESIPVGEEEPKRPESPYGMTKLACENLCFAYASNFGIPCVALRYFTVYGPGQRPDMAFNKFIRAALEGKKITVYGDGSQTRDFTYIDDVVEANLLAMRSSFSGGAVNIAGGSRTSIRDVISIIRKKTGTDVEVEFSSKEAGDVRHTYADTQKARRLLSYSPGVGLEEGIGRQIEWMKSHGP